MVDELKRHPYQGPQTPMERHVAALVDSLKNEILSRSQFAAIIEDAMAHAFWLEAECYRLRKDNRELDEAMMVGLPSVHALFKSEPALTAVDMSCIDWVLEPIRYRAILKPFQVEADAKTWQRIRRSTFRGLLRLIRKEFERTFPMCIADAMPRVKSTGSANG